MTEALATLFEGKPIQVVEESGELWFPLPDLTIAWGTSKDTLSHQLDRNKDLFAGMSGDKYVTYPTGEIQQTCVNERGLYTLIGRLNADRLKNPQAKEAILRFQRWVPELIQQYRKREIVPVLPEQNIMAELKQAREEAEVCRCDPRLLLAAVYLNHGEVQKAKALLQVPGPVHEANQPGIWMIPTDIGRECALSPREVNSWLYNHDFQYPEGSIWRLTGKGMAYGEEYVHTTPYKHEEIRIRWHRSILVASGLRRPLASDQAALPARAGVL